MILVCPNCETRYEIPVELPPEGRKVRCSSCQHIWQATEADEFQPAVDLPNFEDEEIVFREHHERDTPPPVDAAAEPDTTPEPEPASETGETPGADAFSDSAMEEAFSAAVKEATARETDPKDSEDSTDPDFGDDEERTEPETPPIVIGKARKHRRATPGPAAAGWLALLAVIAGIASVAYFQRISVVRALPGAAQAYARLGLPVNVRGLEFDKVGYSWETNTGRPVLEVHGDIVNVTSRPLKVPTVVFGLRTKEKVEVYQWAADVRSEMLPPGERAAFAAQIPTPPKSIRDVVVRFAKVR